MTLPMHALKPEMSHERVFRSFWLPELDGKNRAWHDVSLSILRELYPRVWLYGPCVNDWDTWVNALNRTLDNLAAPDDETLVQELVDDFAGGFRWSSYYLLPQAVQDNNPDWLNPTFQISRSPEVENLKRRLLKSYAPANGSDLGDALASIALFVLTRYLPAFTGGNGEELYAKTLYRHNRFCERWALPSLYPADAPRD